MADVGEDTVPVTWESTPVTTTTGTRQYYDNPLTVATNTMLNLSTTNNEEQQQTVSYIYDHHFKPE